MMLSVFRAGGRRQELDELACIALAVSDETIHMILHASGHSQTMLVGLEDGEAIIKPLEDGDAKLSFEKLYDTCISLNDWHRMQTHKVQNRADIGPEIYEAELVLMGGGEVLCSATVQFPAKDDIDARQALTGLVNHPEFREQLLRRLIMQMMQNPGNLATRGYKRIGDIPAPGFTWEFVDDD